VNDDASDMRTTARKPLLRNIRTELESLVPVEAREWCEVRTRIESGTPWRAILKTIQSEKPGMLVMNVHGKGMLDRALVGSTAERVLRGSCCPVLLIPPMKAGKVQRAKV